MLHLRHLHHQRTALALLACMMMSVAVFACGSEDEPADTAATTGTTATGATGTPANLISEGELARAREGTPERAFLEWWQAVQFRDVDSVLALSTDRALEGVRAEVRAAIAEVASVLGKPRVVARRDVAGDMSLRVLVESFVAGRDGPVASSPYSFRVARNGGRWRVDDVRYLLTTARNLR